MGSTNNIHTSDGGKTTVVQAKYVGAIGEGATSTAGAVGDGAKGTVHVHIGGGKGKKSGR